MICTPYVAVRYFPSPRLVRLGYESSHIHRSNQRGILILRFKKLANKIAAAKVRIGVDKFCSLLNYALNRSYQSRRPGDGERFSREVRVEELRNEQELAMRFFSTFRCFESEGGEVIEEMEIFIEA